jgi:ech hydrogenase subunit D
MIESIKDITADALLGEVGRLKAAGRRLLTVSSVPCKQENGDDAVELLYHFDHELKLEHLRLRVERGAVVPSISPLYFAAFLVENEIQDQMGLGFEGLVLDYERTLLLEEGVRGMSSPFFRAAVVKKQPSAAPAPTEA